MLRAAFPYAGELLETGLPRGDLLRRAVADGAGAHVKARLGIDPDRKVLLYVPTYRDHLRQGRTRYRLGATLDVVALRASLGDDWAVLFRRHRLALGIPEVLVAVDDHRWCRSRGVGEPEPPAAAAGDSFRVIRRGMTLFRCT